jgi:hypothetical protein
VAPPSEPACVSRASRAGSWRPWPAPGSGPLAPVVAVLRSRCRTLHLPVCRGDSEGNGSQSDPFVEQTAARVRRSYVYTGVLRMRLQVLRQW